MWGAGVAPGTRALSPGLACRPAVGYAAPAMEPGKTTDPAALLAELREQVRGLDDRLEALGRHL